MSAPTLSIALPTYAAEAPENWRPVVERARAADVAGVDRVLVYDHVVMGENIDAYGRPESGGVRGGRQPTGPDGHWLEPLTVLSYVAALTSTVRLGTNILIAALRRPAVLAKSVATLDVLSGGRVDLGVGIGWQREEYEAAGLDFGARGRLLDDTLEVLRTLWTTQSAAVELPSVRFSGIHMMPKPAQAGGVPLWISGRLNDRVVERLARYGSGWIPWGEDSTDLAASVPRMRDAVAAAGGDGAALQVAGTLPIVRGTDGSVDLPATMAGVPELVAAGVTDFQAQLKIPDDYDEAVAMLAPVVDAFRNATR